MLIHSALTTQYIGILAQVNGAGLPLSSLPAQRFESAPVVILFLSTSDFTPAPLLKIFQILKIVYLVDKTKNLHRFDVLKAFIPAACFLFSDNTSPMLKASISSTTTWANRRAT